jgi:hypothetical protein
VQLLHTALGISHVRRLARALASHHAQSRADDSPALYVSHVHLAGIQLTTEHLTTCITMQIHESRLKANIHPPNLDPPIFITVHPQPLAVDDALAAPNSTSSWRSITLQCLFGFTPTLHDDDGIAPPPSATSGITPPSPCGSITPPCLAPDGITPPPPTPL